jgi:hypothetical protein
MCIISVWAVNNNPLCRKGIIMGIENGGLNLPRGTLLRFIDEEKGEISEGLFIGPEDNSDFVVVPLSETMLRKKKGDGLNGRCHFQGDMLAFQSSIVEIIDRPVRLWRITRCRPMRRYSICATTSEFNARCLPISKPFTGGSS